MKRHCKRWMLLYITIFMWTSATSLLAQQYTAKLKIIGVEEGLFDRRIIDITQDTAGYLWVISKSRIYRYDGYRMFDFTSTIAKGAFNQNFEIIAFMNKNNMFLFQTNKGIIKMDPISFKQSVLYDYMYKDIDNRIVNIYWTAHSMVCVKPESDVVEIDYNGRILNSCRLEGVMINTTDPVIIKNEEGTRYGLVMPDNYFYVFDLRGRLIRKTFLNLKLKHSEKDITGVYTKEKESGLLILNYLDGFYSIEQFIGDTLIRKNLYNDNSNVFKSEYRINENLRMSVPGDYRILDNNGNVLFDISKLIKNALGTKKPTVLSYFISTDKTLWFNNGYCIVKVVLVPQIFENYLSKKLESENLVGTSMRGIYEDHYGDVWAVSYGLNGDTKYSLHHFADSEKVVSIDPSEKYIASAFYRICPYDNDTVILMNEFGKIFKKVLRTNYMELLFEPKNSYLYSFDVYRTQNKDLLLATSEGLCLIKPGQKYFELNEQYLLNDLGGIKFYYITESSSRDIYVCGNDGIYLLDKSNYKILKKYNDSENADIHIPRLIVKHVLEKGNELYAATESGLLKIDLRQKKYHLYNESNGFPNSYLYCVLQGKGNDLWLSSNNGILRWNTKTERVQVFTTYHGLPGKEFNNASFLKTSKEKLFFGGVNGLTSIDLNKLIKLEERKNKFDIEFCTYFNISRQKTDTLFNWQLQDLSFAAGTNNIGFTFFTSDFQNDNENIFHYRLKGAADTSWKLLEMSNIVRFNYLPAGDYILEAQVAANGLSWSTQSFALPFVVRAYFYNTWWFYVLSMLIIGGTAFLVVNLRINQFKKILNIRNRISADIHDEIGSTLSSITLYSHTLLMTNPRNEQLPILEKIKRNAQQVQEALADIIWSIRPSMDTISNILSRMQTYGKEYTENSNIDFNLKYDPKLVIVSMGMESRKNFYLIFKEAVNNSIKYSNASVIQVEVSKNDNDWVEMKIMDNGQGFILEDSKNGNGMTNMQLRASEMRGQIFIHTSPGYGTAITLKFPVKKSN